MALALMPLALGTAPSAVTSCSSSWALVSLPPPSLQSASLQGVVATGPSDAWAVGYEYTQTFYISPTKARILHWDGSVWAVASTPYLRGQSELNGVDAVSGADVWAVGGTSWRDHNFRSRGHPFAEHWDGATWNLVPAPNPPRGQIGYFQGVFASAANDVWAVGSYMTRSLSNREPHFVLTALSPK